MFGELGFITEGIVYLDGRWNFRELSGGRVGQEMIEQDVNVTGRSGAIPSFAVRPDGPEAFPGIILYMDAPGIREELRNLGARPDRHCGRAFVAR